MKDSILFKPCDDIFTGSGSSKQGTIQASFDNLREMFGEPAFEGKGDKVTTEFVIDYEFHNEVTEDTEYGSFVLYDWYYARDFNDDYKEITWNVGGRSFMDGLAADYAIRIFNKTDVRYGYESAVLAHATWNEVIPA